MIPLASADYELLLASIRDLYSFRDQTSLRSWLLDEALQQLIPSDWLSYNEVDLLNPANTLAILKPEPNAFLVKFFPRFQELAHQHPLITRQMRSPDFSVHKISDFLSQKSYHRLDLYRDVYRHMGVEFQIAATIKLEPHRITALALSRRQNDFTERDRTVLDILRQHLSVSFNNLALARAHQLIMAPAAPAEISGLSRREREVAHWICLGKTNAEIAAILGISARTVQKHNEHIFEKLAVENRMGLARRLLDGPASARQRPGADFKY